MLCVLLMSFPSTHSDIAKTNFRLQVWNVLHLWFISPVTSGCFYVPALQFCRPMKDGCSFTLYLMFEATCSGHIFQGCNCSTLNTQPRASTPVGPFALSICLSSRRNACAALPEEEGQTHQRAGKDNEFQVDLVNSGISWKLHDILQLCGPYLLCIYFYTDLSVLP